MNIGSAIYTVFIGPLKLLFEVVYTFAYFLTGNAGLSIVALSLAMNILLLPLYKQADDIQAKENDIQNKLKKGTDHIKKAFKGDEQYMVLNTYYRQNNYKPIYALRSSISLLLQIPFFIAAYDFLSNEYTVLSSGFGPIGSLGSPDNLLGGLNLLPILMTVINIVSSIIYTKGQPLKNNIQLYIMALAFLIFLYNRPSGLVMYWTLNNLFSLIKNIFAKLKNAQLVLSVLMAVVGVAGLIFILFIHPLSSLLMNVVAIVMMLLFILPLLYYVFLRDKDIFKDNDIKVNNTLFYIEVIFLTIYLGLFIPASVINTSPSEFVDMVGLVKPTTYILNTFFLSLGVFMVWFVIYYSLMNNFVKRVFQYVLAVLCIIAVADYLGFGRNLGTMTNLLIYENGMAYSGKEVLINLVAVAAIFVVVSLLYKFRKSAVQAILVIMIIASSIISVRYLYVINRDATYSLSEVYKARENKAQINLSRNGKNVVIIILDRAADIFFPYIINERKYLQDTYDGFVYYPNTISYSRSTNMGIPSVYGGYEYTPEEMNKRDSEYLVEKHNEALRVMPVLFHDNGFDVTVFDPADANYQSPGDLSMYDDYPYIHRYNTQVGMFEYDPSLVRNNMDLLNRNLFCFGITKSAPLILQPTLYAGGSYNSINRYISLFSKEELLDVSSKAYVKEGFINSFVVLQNMVNITNIKDDDSDNFLMMYNTSTHEPTLMQTPEYNVQTNVDNYDYDKANDYTREAADGSKLKLDDYVKMSHYHINVASLQEVGVWLDYLKEEGVYDNTRVIVVADHGITQLCADENMMIDGVDLLAFNPLLLYKDFNSKGLKTDDTFMTNADTILLATDDIIDNPVNPFTKKQINDDIKKNNEYQHIILAKVISIRENNGKQYLPGIDYYVKDNIFDINNWKTGE